MSDIVPAKQNVLQCLQNRSYDIDFYQREYIWSKTTVETLLNDILYSFELSYNEHKDENFSSELIAKFNWYYLNVFITNTIGGKTFIVDGQQRLSTLTLMAVYLFQRCSDSKLKDVLKTCIASTDMFKGEIFNIDNEKRGRIMQSIMENKLFSEEFSCQTEKTISERYKDISEYFEKLEFDDNKIKVFTGYFLNRLVLVELNIDKNDTPMVFEVINDRGEALKPFEILKGKLIGILPKTETEIYNSIWENSLEKISTMADDFFVDYIKSKFISKRNSSIENSINNEYHRYLFSQNDISERMGFLRQNPNQIQSVKSFIENDLKYYSSLYRKIRTNSNKYLVYCNKINRLNGVYQNILSACSINDMQEDEKIVSIAKEYDRLYVLLQLNHIYDSNSFKELSYDLNEKLREENLGSYRGIFNKVLVDYLKEKKSKEKIDSLLDFETFSKNSYISLPVVVLKYILARVEEYLCNSINLQMIYNVVDISTKNSAVNGYHIEHILSENDTNRSYFKTDEEFEEKRNYIGALLVLQGKSNISSGNEEYAGKLNTYSNGLVWGHTLCDAFYHSNPVFKDFNNNLQDKFGISFKAISKFDEDALQYRSRLLYELIRIIWGN